jgi:hypothetical protein
MNWRGDVRAFSVLLLAAAGFVGGCRDGDELPRQAVKGTVTLDGKPLESGEIQFQPDQSAAGTPAVSGGASISAGAYAIDRAQGLTPGNYKVMIFSHGDSKVDESAPPGEVVAPKGTIEEQIPARYNAETTLKAQVSGDKANVFNFDLKK